MKVQLNFVPHGSTNSDTLRAQNHSAMSGNSTKRPRSAVYERYLNVKLGGAQPTASDAPFAPSAAGGAAASSFSSSSGAFPHEFAAPPTPSSAAMQEITNSTGAPGVFNMRVCMGKCH